jgi:uncharacterized protein (DUF305 family)
MNYKITTWILLALLVVCFGWHLSMMRNIQNPHTQMMNSEHSMGSMMSDMTAGLKGKTGDELDKAFLEGMVIHHQGAVDMAKELQKGTKRPELQKMASDIIDVQTKEINMMQKWLNEWF